MVEEIRFRVGKKIEVITEEFRVFLEQRVTKEEILTLLLKLTDYSLCAYEGQLKKGFLTIEGGHRIGVAGHMNEGIHTLSDISGVNIRIAHECIGCGEEIAKLIQKKNGVYHTLFVSPPGLGKTTYLRDTIRGLSHRGYKISVVDERSEIGACFCGEPQNDLGPCTDIMDNCSKSEGMMMLLRSMSPRIIAVDEMGGEQDVEVARKMVYAGVGLLGTVHADNEEDLLSRSDIRELLKLGIIERLVILEKVMGKRRYRIYDVENGRDLPCAGEHSWTLGTQKLPYFMEKSWNTWGVRDFQTSCIYI